MGKRKVSIVIKVVATALVIGAGIWYAKNKGIINFDTVHTHENGTHRPWNYQDMNGQLGSMPSLNNV